jgi:hypothetical protein
MSNDHRPRISATSWREPYEVLLAIVSGTAEDAERLRPRLAWALRELKKRT